ncbi:MAG: heme exporter protein CcmB [Ardenticatenaceae bacterium]|nr:heme exporter protein CcmB [Ardenticatenaceae bacterium]MCB9444567.1 heme exporter protein CcmB [Ardenticatenaceae bacterium]
MSQENERSTFNIHHSPFFSSVWAIVWKDLQIEKHTRQIISVMAMFSLVTVIMFNFALEANLAAARDVATGLLWATILLAGTLGLNRTLAIERENQTMEAILMAPVPRGAIYLGKVISTTLFVLALEAIMVFMFIVFFDKPFWRPMVLLVLFLGTIGYMAAGVLVTSMTIQTRTREVLLPVLLLPLSLPLVLPAAMTVSAYMFPQLPVLSEVQSPLSLVLIYDLLMLTAGFLTYHYVVES